MAANLNPFGVASRRLAILSLLFAGMGFGGEPDRLFLAGIDLGVSNANLNDEDPQGSGNESVFIKGLWYGYQGGLGILFGGEILLSDEITILGAKTPIGRIFELNFLVGRRFAYGWAFLIVAGGSGYQYLLKRGPFVEDNGTRPVYSKRTFHKACFPVEATLGIGKSVGLAVKFRQILGVEPRSSLLLELDFSTDGAQTED
jgi:hypothetical protein